MDLKRLFLLTIRKSWIVILAALSGALIGCACYLAKHVAFAPAREYEAMSKLYIDFEIASTGEAYQYYNGYTWNDLMKTDPILDETMRNLSAGYERAMVQNSVTADILSDIRLLTITVRTGDPAQTKEILAATQQSLIHFAQSIRELEQIKIYQTTEPTLVIFELQTVRVAIVWGVLFAILALFVLLLCYASDDTIYLPIDGKLLFDVPVLGVKGYQEEKLEQNLAYIGETKEIETIGFEEAEMLTGERYEKLREKDAIILEIPCGKPIGRRVRFELDQFAIQNCKVAGIVLTNPDVKLIRRYYGKEKG